MTAGVALDVYGQGERSDVTGQYLKMHGQRRNPSSQSLRAYAQIIYGVQ
jgi:hypothetical protein